MRRAPKSYQPPPRVHPKHWEPLRLQLPTRGAEALFSIIQKRFSKRTGKSSHGIRSFSRRRICTGSSATVADRMRSLTDVNVVSRAQSVFSVEEATGEKISRSRLLGTIVIRIRRAADQTQFMV
ncbi:unnamed protein product [Nesidiocoris tenuis]|uniref:Uncharacterized protein n=1 Tax=Nesidiocoris tenuis TaxID=355587 RepID=A0A6H5HFZ9_9HEMI|nr:unnamed protein product [Nesidiocoris tenuis]